jgi:hypothetical protein
MRREQGDRFTLMIHPSRAQMLHSFRTLGFLTALFLLPLHEAAAQPIHPGPPTALEAGALALQFRVGPNFSLTHFAGSTISLKHHLTADRAIRYGLSLGGQLQTEDEWIPTQALPGRTIDRPRLDATVSAHYVIHPRLSERPWPTISFFLGGGPEFSLFRDGTRTVHPLETGQGVTRSIHDDRRTRYGAGLAGVAGVEWFVHPRISLSAEHQVLVAWSREERIVDRRTEREWADTIEQPRTRQTWRGWNLGSSGGRLGVSVYF